jgi:hypothetical protein
MALMSSFFLAGETFLTFGPLRTLEAATRSSLIAEMQRAKARAILSFGQTEMALLEEFSVGEEQAPSEFPVTQLKKLQLIRDGRELEIPPE